MHSYEYDSNIVRRAFIRILQFVSKVTLMKDRVYIEVPKDYREEIRGLHGEPLIVDVNRVLDERPNKKQGIENVSDREVKTFARDLHTQLAKTKKDRK